MNSPSAEPEVATSSTKIEEATTAPAQRDDLEHASDPSLTQDLALALLKRRDLDGDAVERISKNAALMKQRRIRLAIASHPHASRRIALRLIREFYTLDLMQFSLLPAVAADLKHAADEILVARLSSVTLGERISLARRGSGVVAGALLLDKETRVWQTALENPRLTENAIVKSLLRTNATAAFVGAVCRHPKWSPRYEIRLALLRNEKTPMARALEFARTLPPMQLRDVLHVSRLPGHIKNYLRETLNH